MANEPTYTQPRAHARGEDQSMGAGQHKAAEMPLAASGNLAIVHCHDCWRYTDDTNRAMETAKNAVTLLVNSTPALEQSEAYRAADAYLAAQFRAGGPAKLGIEPRW